MPLELTPYDPRCNGQHGQTVAHAVLPPPIPVPHASRPNHTRGALRHPPIPRCRLSPSLSATQTPTAPHPTPHTPHPTPHASHHPPHPRLRLPLLAQCPPSPNAPYARTPDHPPLACRRLHLLPQRHLVPNAHQRPSPPVVQQRQHKRQPPLLQHAVRLGCCTGGQQVAPQHGLLLVLLALGGGRLRLRLGTGCRTTNRLLNCNQEASTREYYEGVTAGMAHAASKRVKTGDYR